MATQPYKIQLRHFLELGLDRCMNAVGARSGSVLLLDNPKKELVLEIAKNPRKKRLTGIRTLLGERVAGKVALQRKPLLVANIDEELEFPLMPRYMHYHTKSFLSVPLEHSGQIMGVLNMTDKTKGGEFDAADLEAVENICGYIGIGIHSLKDFFEKQQRINRKLSRQISSLKKSADQDKKFSSLGKLVGGLVHEINNPLDGVMRYVNLTLTCMEGNDAAREYLEEARSGLKRIAKTVRSLLDFSWSLAEGEGELDINKTVEESIFMLSHYIGARKITVKKILSASLPSVKDFRLKYVFNNMIKNACEAMEAGGVLTIYTSFDSHNNIEIRFKDTGYGIPADKQDKIFDPFYTTKNIGEGSGLGLAISSEIVQRYGGNILLQSQPGQGTSFIIQIPVS